MVQPTPCLRSWAFSEELGARAWFKYETLQLTGSFKIRGAYNKIASLPREEVRRGVITASAGNHAQGVAFSATAAGVPSIIVMPVTTPLIKIENTRRLGGEVVLEGEIFDEAYEEARRLERERGARLRPPLRRRAGDGRPGDDRPGDPRGRRRRPRWWSSPSAAAG